MNIKLQEAVAFREVHQLVYAIEESKELKKIKEFIFKQCGDQQIKTDYPSFLWDLQWWWMFIFQLTTGLPAVI